MSTTIRSGAAPDSRAVAARIAGIATHFPKGTLTNDDLAGVQDWSAEKIFEKTGISCRHIAATEETALDLAVAACRSLFDNHPEAADADFLIFCTQAPDYILPTSACILQDRLGLPKSIGALDVNLGCSGFVYGLALATGLLASSAAKSVLLVTADTYSKFINARDRSTRTLFGDGAAATLIVGDQHGRIGPFVFGTDGSGAGSLIVKAGGARVAATEASREEHVDEFGNVRSDANLYMDGSAVMNFTLREVPKVLDDLCAAGGFTRDALSHVVLHQANKFMLDALRRKLKLPPEKVPYEFEAVGNTVSSTIPIVIKALMDRAELKRGDTYAVVGFGVGLSWAAGVVRI